MTTFPYPLIISDALADRAQRLVDEDRVETGLVLRGTCAALVRSRSGNLYEVIFDAEGGVCSCSANRYGRVCTHLVAAMLSYADFYDSMKDGEP